VYVFIANYVREHGYAPSCREVASEMEISLSPAQKHINSLYRKGYIDKVPYAERGIILKNAQ
jgi:SOS-response transcriptional repressor LexA